MKFKEFVAMPEENFITFLKELNVEWNSLSPISKELHLHKYINEEVNAGVFTDLCDDTDTQVVVTYGNSGIDSKFIIQIDQPVESVSNQIDQLLDLI